MKKYQFNFFEDAGIVLFIVAFVGLTVWGVVDILTHGLTRSYQLPVFMLFAVALCTVGIVSLRQQMRLRTCPKCQAAMMRAPSKGDGFRRQKCPQCATVMKTSRKNSMQALDEVETAGAVETDATTAPR